MRNMRIGGRLLLLIGAALLLAGCGQAAVVATATPGAGGPSGEGTASPSPTNPPTATPTGQPPTSAAPATVTVGSITVGTSEPATGPITSPPLRDITPVAPPSGVGTVITPNAGGVAEVNVDLPGATVQLQTGDTLQVNLTGNYDWGITIANPAVLRVVSAAPATGAGRAVYKAAQAGETNLLLTGDPPCLKSNPPCGLMSRGIEFKVIVR
jgi:hypothetical protein